ncbi:MAG: DUF3027 domain-containing protein [Microbacterium gubbeenense]|uniref:DUF3027 domain-containing protein n=2 Tax=Microbacterium gubbeenense TaxID=159896 RepID=UPI003F9AEC3A
MTSTSDFDPSLVEAKELALSALKEITPEETIGDPADYAVEDDGVVSLRFRSKLLGYPGWFWTVSLTRVEGEEPTVLEAELLPGEGALLAPEWVPWSQRLEEYKAHQAEMKAAEESNGDAGDDDDDDDDYDDESDYLHAGDVDGVDIDELDDSAHDDDDDDDEDSDGDDDDEE